MNCPVCFQQVRYHDYFSQTRTISSVTKVAKFFLAFSLRKDHDAAAKVEGNRVHGVHDLGRKIISMFAVATSILPHMSSTRSRRVSNARLFVGAAASVRLSRAPHFSGGDEHPAALGQAVFVQQWRRATCLAARPTPKTSSAPVDHLRAYVRACVCVCVCSDTQTREHSKMKFEKTLFPN